MIEAPVKIESPANPAPAEKVTPLKRSDAVRLGSLMIEGNHGSLYNVRPDGKPTACAIGAAALAWGMELNDDMPDTEPVYKRFRGRLTRTFDCPLKCGKSAGRKQPIDSIVIHINDQHQMDRQYTADWLQKQGL